MPSAQKLRLQSYAWLSLNTLFWGAAFIVSKPALDITTPFLLLFYRFTVATLIMSPWLFHWLSKKSLRTKLPSIVSIELLGTVLYLSLLYSGLAQTTAIEASLLATTSPLFIIAMGILLLKEKLTKQEWIGLAISFTGVTLISLLPLLNGQASIGEMSLIGNGLIILANIVNGLYIIAAKKYYQRIPKLFVASVGFALGSVAFGLLSFIRSGATSDSYTFLSTTAFAKTVVGDWQQPEIIVATLYMAFLASIIGLTAYLKGQEHIEASEASLFYYLQPLIYLPLGVVVLQETISGWQMAGLVLILVGVLYVQQPWAKRRR